MSASSWVSVPLEAGGDRPAPGVWAGRVAALLAGMIVGIVILTLLAQEILGAVVENATNAVEAEVVLPAAPDFPQLAERSVVYSADGRELATLHDAVNRLEVSLDDLPAHVWQAVLAAEDRRFFTHDGYDLEGISRAALENVRAGTITQGGSTITQQLAKTFVGSERTLERKAEELFTAMALEERYTKEELLERYLNEAYIGSGAYGVAAAAEEFFARPVEELRVEQAALLAGLIRSPGSLDPRRNPDGALRRRNAVLAGMVEEGYLEPERAEVLRSVPLGVVAAHEDAARDPYIVEAVKQEFFSNPAFGETRPERVERLFSGGLHIYTTIDPDLQRIADSVVRRHFPARDGVTASIASVDPRTGAVLVAAFGRDFDKEQFNLALQGRRQPGSAYKPFVLASALEAGYPLSLPLQGRNGAEFEHDPHSPPWKVHNFGGSSYGRPTARRALIRSVNTAFADLVLLVGTPAVVDMTERLGIDVDAAYAGIHNPAIALGGLEVGVTPLEMASAYGAFADGGVHRTPHVIARVVDDRGEEIYVGEGAARQAIAPSANAAMVEVLQENVARGTGTRAALPGWPVAGKTGTTQENRDVWFVGITPVMSTAVWVGNPDERQRLQGMSSSRTAAPLWREFMAEALEGRKPRPYPDTGVTPGPVTPDEPVEVPDVRRKGQSEAVTVLMRSRLVPRVRRVEHALPRGVVVWQRPDPGTMLDVGQEVLLGVSQGPPPPPPPPATEEPQEEATEDAADQPQEEAQEEAQEGGPPGRRRGHRP